MSHPPFRGAAFRAHTGATPGIIARTASSVPSRRMSARGPAGSPAVANPVATKNRPRFGER
jgi:hypothetical protein